MAGFQCPMLTEIYIEALLADESLADQVWELLNAGLLRMRWRRWRGGLRRK